MNFLHLLKNYMFLTICPIINFFKTITDFLTKIKSHIVSAQSYLRLVNVIIKVEIK